MKEIIGMNEEGTVEITLMEYRALQQMSGRVSACVEYIESQDSKYVEIDLVLKVLGYAEIACDREIARKKIEVPAV